MLAAIVTTCAHLLRHRCFLVLTIIGQLVVVLTVAPTVTMVTMAVMVVMMMMMIVVAVARRSAHARHWPTRVATSGRQVSRHGRVSVRGRVDSQPIRAPAKTIGAAHEGGCGVVVNCELVCVPVAFAVAIGADLRHGARSAAQVHRRCCGRVAVISLVRRQNSVLVVVVIVCVVFFLATIASSCTTDGFLVVVIVVLLVCVVVHDCRRDVVSAGSHQICADVIDSNDITCSIERKVVVTINGLVDGVDAHAASVVRRARSILVLVVQPELVAALRLLAVGAVSLHRVRQQVRARVNSMVDAA